MQLIQLYIQKEAVRDTVDELGQLGIVQFRDLNPDINAFQRSFVNEIKRFDEMQRKVRFFEEQLIKSQADGSAPLVIRQIPHHQKDTPTSKVLIDELEAKLEEYEKDLLLMNNNQEILDRNYNELIELANVLEKDATFFNESGGFDSHAGRPDDQQPLLGDEMVTKGGSLGFVTGVIPRDKVNGFERVIWRATRGNVFMRHEEIQQPIKDPQSGEMVSKDVFIIFFQGSRLQEKIKRLCDSFGVSLYHCPATASGRAELQAQVQGRLRDLNSILIRTKDHSRSVLSRIAENLNEWKQAVIKEKAIYHTLNLFNNDLGRKCLIAEAWCPVSATAEIQRALQRANERSGAMVPSILTVIHTHEQPPTYFKTDKFTQGFQGIVDSYGIARYHEVNPAVFTIVTFPFLFGVMFGDLGHGAIMTAVAAYLVLNEKKIAETDIGEMGRNLFDGRYIILLMGLFAMYVGLIYNETFALSINFFGSSWIYPDLTGDPISTYSNEPWCLPFELIGKAGQTPNNTACMPANMVNNSRYYFGVDPYWKNADNDLTYYNSLKMKLSVIFGLVQMVLGIILSALNAKHFRKPYNFFFEFIPQMIFMLGIFGYMVFLIFYKWTIPWTNLLIPGSPEPCPTLQGHSPPNILNVVIQMFLSPFSSNPAYTFYSSQKTVQMVLLFAALASVPVMLGMKPFFLWRDHQKKLARRGNYHAVPVAEEEEEAGEHGEEFEFSEIMVHQIIHTIEFVLGAVSNTASYLRLWALSLAHSELAAVFWQMIMLTGLSSAGSSAGIPLTFACWGAWAGLTVGVLLLMESLSAFLHALRLHWVEFQNKFYMGDGYAFIPFSYVRILQEEAEAAAAAAGSSNA